LTEKDRDSIRAFKLVLLSKMPRIAFAHMHHAFRHKMDISSHWAIIHRIAILICVEPVWYHCCPNSCMAYMGPYSDLTHCRCRECKEPRFTHSDKLHKAGEISDVFDSDHYRTLRRTKVTVDGKKLPHCYFSGKHDIALGICLDSYLLFQ
ncbi:hypothetical protein B0H10DRAFT_1763781, partial [Mycena sp. CBHHK59/15]